jgi:hypothetical protein
MHGIECTGIEYWHRDARPDNCRLQGAEVNHASNEADLVGQLACYLRIAVSPP